MRPLIHSTKHYVQTSLTPIAAGAQIAIEFIESVDTAAKSALDHVEEGASVKTIFVEYWLTSQTSAEGSYIAAIVKVPAGAGNPTTVEMAALGNYNNKKNVLYTTQGLFPENGTFPLQIYKNWLKIPKSKQRMGLGDKVMLVIFMQGAVAGNVCGFATYKEYT